MSSAVLIMSLTIRFLMKTHMGACDPGTPFRSEVLKCILARHGCRIGQTNAPRETLENQILIAKYWLILLHTSISLLHHALAPHRLASQLLGLPISLAGRVPPLARGLHVRHAVGLGLLP